MIKKILNSPNFSKNPRNKRDVKLIIIHYTGMQSKIASLKRLTNTKSKVSCHYLIDRKGIIIKLLDDSKIAWHAGKSKWKSINNLNKNSIGIELVNKGHKYGFQKYTKQQLKALIKLCLFLKKKYSIKKNNILGHSDIAPLRKQDPGEKFPWKMLYKKNLSIWYSKPKTSVSNFKKFNRNSFFSNLYKIGYRYFDKTKKSKYDHLIVQAFQRRFLPNKVTGHIDLKTYEISHFLALQSKN